VATTLSVRGADCLDVPSLHFYIGDDFTGKNTPAPDSDPRDTCAGHGTHVAGIIAANPGNEFNVTGVAYGATLQAYRVFGCVGDTAEDGTPISRGSVGY